MNTTASPMPVKIPPEGLRIGRVRYGAANHRYVPIGTVQIRKAKRRRKAHVRVKIRDDGPEHLRWKYLAIIVWERVNGPVPAGMCIWHINGNPLDCRLENLEVITKRERLRRNIANNIEKCRTIWRKQAVRLGRKHWHDAVASRTLKKMRRQREASEAL